MYMTYYLFYMSVNKTADLLKDPINILIFKLSTPIMLAALLRTSYDLNDIVFASRLGGLQVASIAFVGPLFLTLQAIGLGLSLGGVSIIAKSIGKGLKDEASKYANELRFLTIILGIILTILGIFLSDTILKTLGISGEFFDQAAIYTRIRFLSILFALIFQLYMSFYNSQGKMKMSLYMTFVGLILNATLNAICIFIFDLGIAGLAYATLTTQIIQTIIIISIYHKETHNFDLKFWFLSSKPDFDKWKKILLIGLPLSFSLGSSQLGHLLINSFIVSFGYEVVAAFAIGNQINTIFWDPSTAIGQSLVPLLAQNWGKKSLERIKKTIRSGMIYTIVFSAICAVLIQFVMHPVATFLSKGDIIITDHVVNYLRLCGWAIIPWGVFQTLSGIFNSFQKTKTTMIISMIRLWGLRIPAIILLKNFMPWIEEYAVWMTVPISNVITAIVAIILYYRYVPKYIFRPMEQELNL